MSVLVRTITHELKTWPEFFEAILSGEKTFEVREDDRDFREGDTLVLREWDPANSRYTGREIRKTVGYTLAVTSRAKLTVMALRDANETQDSEGSA